MYPDAPTVPEVSGVLGGRNDLIQFFFNGRRVVFELFFSPSQVPQDLRLLELAQADVRIAVLLDKQIDPKLATEYCRKKPDHFPYLWLSRVLLPQYETYCCARLRELIDENAAVVRLRRILSHPAGEHFEKPFVKQLESIENALGINPTDTGKAKKNLTGGQVFSLLIIGHIKKLGVSIDRLCSLYIWLQDHIEEAFHSVTEGFQTFLVTDLRGQHAIWTDGDLVDNIIMGANEKDNANIIICLNKILNDIMVKKGYKKATVHWHLFYNYAENPMIIIPPTRMFQQDKSKVE
jgi:hypothetical protein